MWSERQHHHTAFGELLYQNRRYRLGSRSYYDSIKGGPAGHVGEAIPDHHVDILIAESRKSRTSGVGQRSKPFDCHYLSGEARKDGRLIS